MSKIFVTGGGGFIGSHCCISFLEAGHHLIVFDSFINSSKKVFEDFFLIKSLNSNFKNKITLVEGDLRDTNLLQKVFRREYDLNSPIEIVAHFAGLKAVGESVNNPILYWDNNVGGSISLLKVMEEFNCFKIVFSSSATVYGLPEKIPIKESTQIRPNNPYGETKAAIENILFNLKNNNTNKWEIIILRYFNPIGSHPSGLLGENPNGIPNNIFPILCDVASVEIPEILVFGGDWPTNDGTGVRDYIHVVDLAKGHLLSVDYLLKKNSSKLITLNLGTGQGYSVLELIKTFSEVSGIQIPYKIVGRREGDVAVTIADVAKSKKILNWESKLDLHDMCRDGWRSKSLMRKLR
jgi:UDP-glucose 4-epimerase